MSEIDWDKENITTKEWLNVEVNQDSIFHAIQHLGLQRLNVVELNKKHLTKRNFYGLICISSKKIALREEKPFIFDVDSHHFGPTQVSTQVTENLTQRKRIFQQKIKNAEMTINLVNYALLASPSNFGERCGPFLKNYFDSKMETAIMEGNDLLASVIPIAYVHNYTAKKFPATPLKNFVTYFGFYRSTVSFDSSDDRILKIDPSGDLIESDNTKELVEELSELRKQICEESGGETNVLDTSSFLETSSLIDLYDEEPDENVEEQRSFAALASLTEVMENVIESSDYELLIEDQNEISAARREFKQLWFEGMENYQLFLDPEFDAFMEFYRMILHQDEKEVKRVIEGIEEKAVVEFRKEETAKKQLKSREKENQVPRIEKMPLAQRISEEKDHNLRKRRAPPVATPKPSTSQKKNKKIV
uniref:Uncharacterized protein n=1 Tax=Panagrolaimus sp. ES5 TaxID=591445 RepID=A0AC34FXR0_9BILA